MKEISTEIDINSTSEKVWSVLTNFDAYPEWNPFIKSVSGDIVQGKKFKAVLQQPDSNPMVFKPTCLVYEDNKEFRWLGHLLIPGLFDGEHSFQILSKQEKGVTFIQKEKFKGILVPLLWKQLNTKTRQGFEAMNSKLKELAES